MASEFTPEYALHVINRTLPLTIHHPFLSPQRHKHDPLVLIHVTRYSVSA